jgi:hypothetical protein
MVAPEGADPEVEIRSEVEVPQLQARPFLDVAGQERDPDVLAPRQGGEERRNPGQQPRPASAPQGALEIAEIETDGLEDGRRELIAADAVAGQQLAGDLRVGLAGRRPRSGPG